MSEDKAQDEFPSLFTANQRIAAASATFVHDDDDAVISMLNIPLSNDASASNEESTVVKTHQVPTGLSLQDAELETVVDFQMSSSTTDMYAPPGPNLGVDDGATSIPLPISQAHTPTGDLQLSFVNETKNTTPGDGKTIQTVYNESFNEDDASTPMVFFASALSDPPAVSQGPQVNEVREVSSTAVTLMPYAQTLQTFSDPTDLDAYISLPNAAAEGLMLPTAVLERRLESSDSKLVIDQRRPADILEASSRTVVSDVALLDPSAQDIQSTITKSAGDEFEDRRPLTINGVTVDMTTSIDKDSSALSGSVSAPSPLHSKMDDPAMSPLNNADSNDHLHPLTANSQQVHTHSTGTLPDLIAIPTAPAVDADCSLIGYVEPAFPSADTDLNISAHVASDSPSDDPDVLGPCSAASDITLFEPAHSSDLASTSLSREPCLFATFELPAPFVRLADPEDLPLSLAAADDNPPPSCSNATFPLSGSLGLHGSPLKTLVGSCDEGSMGESDTLRSDHGAMIDMPSEQPAQLTSSCKISTSLEDDAAYVSSASDACIVMEDVKPDDQPFDDADSNTMVCQPPPEPISAFSMESIQSRSCEEPNDVENNVAFAMPFSSLPSSQVTDPHCDPSRVQCEDSPNTYTADLTADDIMPGKKATACEDYSVDDCLPSSSPPDSSQPRASSPVRIFSSSPLRDSFCSPPSSPRCFAIDSDEKEHTEESSTLRVGAQSVIGGSLVDKRKADDELDATERADVKRFKTEEVLSLPPPPNPKRPTQASQKRQFRKLVKPFRSPLVNYEDVLAGKDGVYASGHVRHNSPAPKEDSAPTKARIEEQIRCADSTPPMKDHTANAGKPFRLPAAPMNTKAKSSVLSAPTIQFMQARVQKLKQALKIKSERSNGGKDQNLGDLVTKWRTVGREVAWLVWDTVKDLDPSTAAMGAGVLPTKGGWDENERPSIPRTKANPSSSQANSGWGLQSGWGYDNGKVGATTSNWGWDASGKGDDAEKEGGDNVDDKMEVCDDDQEVQSHTLGTMLRHMGIDPTTLGWDEDEGDFVGDP